MMGIVGILTKYLDYPNLTIKFLWGDLKLDTKDILKFRDMLNIAPI